MKKSLLLGVMLAMISLQGCSTQAFSINGNSRPFIKEKNMSNFFIYGIAQDVEIDAGRICGGANRVARVESSLGVLSGALSIITLGIYTPRDYAVYCN